MDLEKLHRILMEKSKESISNTMPEENALIGVIRALGWGEVNITVNNGKPVMISYAVKKIKLTEK